LSHKAEQEKPANRRPHKALASISVSTYLLRAVISSEAFAVPPSLDIVTVNWNTGGMLAACVASLPAARTPLCDIRQMTVVDNASSDRSAEDLPVTDIPLVLHRNSENRGFAAACNQGAAGSPADYLLFLNPDSRLSASSLAPALAILEGDGGQEIGILGIRLVDERGQTQRTCARTPTPGRLIAQAFALDRLLPRYFHPHFMTEWDHGETRPVEQVMGAFLLIRHSLFQELQGFDERFFVYYEDVDLCLRARQAGWSVVHCADGDAFHRGGGSSDHVRSLRLFYLLRSRIQFAHKHFEPLAAMAVTAATAVVEPLVRLFHALASGQAGNAAAVTGATMRLWRALPGIIRRPRPAPQSPGQKSPGQKSYGAQAIVAPTARRR
jgi:N-acetylglucosaminyl-diphospho-decaprenol L-rhamnosyltransferase